VSRRTPAQGVHLTSDQPVIVWLTICSKDRVPWLACTEVMDRLHGIWLNDASAWLMGDYLIMPDHLHGFCAPHDPRFSVEQWVAYWKSRFTQSTARRYGHWQRCVFHHRLRSREEFREKLTYMMENPMRKGLVGDWEGWPWRGRVHDVTW
jgi:putative transposase